VTEGTPVLQAWDSIA